MAHRFTGKFQQSCNQIRIFPQTIASWQNTAKAPRGNSCEAGSKQKVGWIVYPLGWLRIYSFNSFCSKGGCWQLWADYWWDICNVQEGVYTQGPWLPIKSSVPSQARREAFATIQKHCWTHADLKQQVHPSYLMCHHPILPSLTPTWWAIRNPAACLGTRVVHVLRIQLCDGDGWWEVAKKLCAWGWDVQSLWCQTLKYMALLKHLSFASEPVIN